MGMKCIRADLRRALGGRWFPVALIATAAALYMSIGSRSYEFISILTEGTLAESGFRLDTAMLLKQGLQGDFGMMTLPALSALPFSAQALTELKCGAIRPVIFRTGRKGWIFGKVLGCLFSGMLLQVMGALTLALIFQLLALIFAGLPFPLGDLAPLRPLLLQRMLCGGIWACVGCLIALMTETTSAAYLAPLCLCYSMMMIGRRFFPEALLLDPTQWLSAAPLPLLLLLALLVATLTGYLQRKVTACA